MVEGVGRHTVPEEPPPTKAKPRYRFLVALGGIVFLGFIAMAVVAAIFPDAGPVARAGADNTTAANPFPNVPGNPTTQGPSPVVTGSIGGPPPVTKSPTKPPAAPKGNVTGVYSVDPATTWEQGFQAQVVLTNHTSSSQNWQVRVEYPDNVTRYVISWVNGMPAPSAQATAHGAVFTGTVPIAAGASVTLFFQFDKTAGSFSPRQCTINGRACSTS
jgi:hypothetical protein